MSSCSTFNIQKYRELDITQCPQPRHDGEHLDRDHGDGPRHFGGKDRYLGGEGSIPKGEK